MNQIKLQLKETPSGFIVDLYNKLIGRVETMKPDEGIGYFFYPDRNGGKRKRFQTMEEVMQYLHARYQTLYEASLKQV
jgi:phage pi2 protein 07